MKLFIISQDINNDYDTYNAAVVAAHDEEDARSIHPNGWQTAGDKFDYSWVHPSQVHVKYLGETDEERGVVIASFYAG